MTHLLPAITVAAAAGSLKHHTHCQVIRAIDAVQMLITLLHTWRAQQQCLAQTGA